MRIQLSLCQVCPLKPNTKSTVLLYIVSQRDLVIFITRLTSHVQQGRTTQIYIAYDNWHICKVDQIYCVTFLKERKKEKEKKKKRKKEKKEEKTICAHSGLRGPRLQSYEV